MKITMELVERFHEKWTLNQEKGCWEWTASTAGKGYGQIKIPKTRRQIYAHQLSYLIHCGSIPDGLFVCHACDNTRCVRPSHLFLGTSQDNNLDALNKGHNVLVPRKPGNQKLLPVQVKRIHELTEHGFSQGYLASVYGVAQQTICKIVHGEKWPEFFEIDSRAESSDLS